MTCMYCGAHMTIAKVIRKLHVFMCTECGAEYKYEWTLPVWEPGTDTLTQNGEYLVRLYSTCNGHTRERTIKELQKKRATLGLNV